MSELDGMKRRLLAAVVLCGVIAVSLGPSAAGADPITVAEARTIALERASAALGRHRQTLRVAALEEVAEPADGHHWLVAKVQPADGSLAPAYVTYIDIERGAAVAAHRWRRATPPGQASRFDPDVEAALDQGRPLTVAVWVRSDSERDVVARVHRGHPRLVDQAGDPAGPTRRLQLRARGLLRAAHARAAEEAVAPIARRAESLGLTVEHASALLPVLWVTGSPARIHALAREDAVIRVQSSGTTELALGVAGKSDDITGPTGYSRARGYTGAGVRIAVVEYGNVRWSERDLDTIPDDRRESYTTSADGQPHREPHPGHVMAVIASDDRRRPGIAPDAYYISSGSGGYRVTEPGAERLDQDFRVVQAIENAILPTKGDADVVNLSLGMETTLGKAAMRAYVDLVVDLYDVHVAAAAGNFFNRGCRSGKRSVLSPGTGWNVVTVGGVNDRGTARWSDDRLYTESCFGDPPGGTFKPEMSAPAVGIHLNGGNRTGTSFATPQVAGAMALLIDQVESLRTRPSLVKAILLAGSFKRRTVARKVHDREGVGTLAMKWAHWAAENRERSDGTDVAGSGEVSLLGDEQDGCFEAPGVQTITVDTVPGREVRFVISWQSHGSYDQGSSFGPNDDFFDARKSDIDLVVRTTSGDIKTSERHVNRTVEVAQWRAKASEMPYSVRVRPVAWDCDLPSEEVAWAWVAPG